MEFHRNRNGNSDINRISTPNNPTTENIKKVSEIVVGSTHRLPEEQNSIREYRIETIEAGKFTDDD